jgi:hypothetical protein
MEPNTEQPDADSGGQSLASGSVARLDENRQLLDELMRESILLRQRARHANARLTDAQRRLASEPAAHRPTVESQRDKALDEFRVLRMDALRMRQELMRQLELHERSW